MNRVSKWIGNLKRFFVFYRKPEHLRVVRRWHDVRLEDIPAVETSDSNKLCKKPLVSVLILTYNQERFVRQAIESVLEQKTDFEYEVLIGDDCSTDGTGEICAEYQRKHPEKIRFITADRNVRKLGGNVNRLRCRVRGEFVAHLEGDDYWTDPQKLQKQIDVFRNHPEVTLCLSGQERLNPNGTVEQAHNAHFDELLAKSPERGGTLFNGDDYFAHPLGGPIGIAMYRKADIDQDELYTFFYRTSYTYYYILLRKGKGYLLKRPMVMYRVNPNGVWNGNSAFEKAKKNFEYYCMLSLHAPNNTVIREQVDIGWRAFRRYLFPWAILGAIHRSVAGSISRIFRRKPTS